jgi:hypothetical protein
MNFPVIRCLAYPDIAGTVVVLSDGTTRTVVGFAAVRLKL